MRLTRMEATFWGLHLASKKTRPSSAIGICAVAHHLAPHRANSANGIAEQVAATCICEPGRNSDSNPKLP